MLPEWSDPDRRDQALHRLSARVLYDLQVPNGSHRHYTPQLVPPLPSELTPHERLILQALASGLNREETAQVVGCGLESVKEELKTVRRKLAAKTTAHAVANALRQGFIQ